MMRVAIIFALIFSLGAAPASHATSRPAFPLPSRSVNVVPHGKDIEKDWTVRTQYLELGWTPRALKQALGRHDLDRVIRVTWSNDLLADELQSRWFADIDALLDAGFRVVIVAHTNLRNSPRRFQHYDTSAEADLAIEARTRAAAPTWHLFMDNWRLIVDRYADHPGVVGYEPFNELVPATHVLPPGRALMRDFGAWVDEFESKSLRVGKHVFIEGPWASTSFWALANQRDDAGRMLSDIVAAHRGLVHPTIHLYGWYGESWEHPDTLAEVKLFALASQLSSEMRGRIDKQYRHYVRSRNQTTKYNLTYRANLREWEAQDTLAQLPADAKGAQRELLNDIASAWSNAEQQGKELNESLSEIAGEPIDVWTGAFGQFRQADRLPAEVAERFRAIVAERNVDRRQAMLLAYVESSRYAATVRAIDDARAVAGIGPDEPVWVSEIGASSGDFAAGAELRHRLGAAHFRAMVRAASDRNAPLTLWHTIGPDGSFGILPEFGTAPSDGQRNLLDAFLHGR